MRRNLYTTSNFLVIFGPALILFGFVASRTGGYHSGMFGMFYMVIGACLLLLGILKKCWTLARWG